MRTIILFGGIVAALVGAFWIVVTVLSLQHGGVHLFDFWAVTTVQSANFAVTSASAALVAFLVSVILGYADKQLEQTKKTNELLTQLVAQSGNTEAATNEDAIPTAEPVVEDDISSADGFTADD